MYYINWTALSDIGVDFRQTSALDAVPSQNSQLPCTIIFHLRFTPVSGLWQIMRISQCVFWKVCLLRFLTQNCFIFPLPPLMTSELCEEQHSCVFSWTCFFAVILNWVKILQIYLITIKTVASWLHWLTNAVIEVHRVETQGYSDAE